MLTPEAREKARAARKAAPSRRQKMSAFAGTFAEQRQRFPQMALPIIDQAEKGSLPAAIKLLCLDCSGWARKEVRDCVISWCPPRPCSADRRPDMPTGPCSADRGIGGQGTC